MSTYYFILATFYISVYVFYKKIPATFLIWQIF
nr:MAG TPA: hypothetical protein [Caudoviricetes sp.]